MGICACPMGRCNRGGVLQGQRDFPAIRKTFCTLDITVNKLKF